jgi:hypothetical protein
MVPIRVGHMATALPYPVKLFLPPITQVDTRVQARITGPELDIIIPSDDARHTKLGRFMDSWSALESSLGFLFSKLLSIKLQEAFLTLSKIGMKNTVELLDGLGMRKLASGDSAELTRLTERLNRMNGKRNILVHGQWVLEVNVFVRKNRTEAYLMTQFLREITPTDPEDAEALGNPRNQKERVRYTFTMKRIDAAARDTDILNRDFGKFAESMNFKELTIVEILELLSRSQPYRVTYSTP